MSLKNNPDLALAHTLFNLPPHLIQTYLATFITAKPTNATEISELTTRPRAQESSYLNQLTLMGYLNKTRHNRTALFTIRGQNCPQKGDASH